MLKEPLPTKTALLAIPPQYFLGGIFVTFYVLAITWIAPKFGLGNAIFIVLMGQLIVASVIDHFAVLGVPRAPITSIRALGIVLIIIGVYLAKKPSVLLQ